MSADHRTARSEVLQRIAGALGDRSSSMPEQIQQQWRQLPRLYRRAGTATAEDALALLRHRLRDYDARVEDCTATEVASTVERLLERRGACRMAVPQGFPADWLPSRPEFVLADELDAFALDACDGVLTGATLAIAETGTIVLQSTAGQGRRAASLVPDYHLCVVRVEDVVQTVPEAFDRLAGTSRLPTTFISGPSATADIEMTRIKGVHGPRFLEVLLVS